MHKSYQSTLPASNRLLKKRWDDKYYAEHQILVRDAKPMVDTRPPRTYMHLHLKLKKIQLEEERAATIERDNRILLEKMSTIMRTSGGIDNKNGYQGKSLNHEKRRRELLRVSQENSTMIQRITHRKAEVTTEDWKREWSKNSNYLNNISKYSSDWFERNRRGITRTSFQNDDRRATSEPRTRSAEPAAQTQNAPPSTEVVPPPATSSSPVRQKSARSSNSRKTNSQKQRESEPTTPRTGQNVPESTASNTTPAKEDN